MKNAKDCWCIQIETTNKCKNRCSNCTHLIQYTKPWEIDVNTFESALDSLKGWDKVIGLIGGDPVLHSSFEEMTELFKRRFPNKEQRGLWTADFKGKEDYCRENYGYINYNPHSEVVMHQPVLCCIKDIIEDKKERDKYISDCWLADKWSPSITPKGVYRCEVMGAMDMAAGCNLGLPIEDEWYNRPLEDFQKQIDTFCHLCSISVPLMERVDKDNIDDITISAKDVFKDSPRIKKGDYELHSENSLTVKNKDGWQPFKYLVRMRNK
jgi:hypothetical protein